MNVIDRLVEVAAEDLASRPDGALPLFHRTRIWRAMGPRRPLIPDPGVSLAHRMRAELAMACLGKVLPFWEAAGIGRPSIGELARRIRSYLDDGVGREELDRRSLDVWDEFNDRPGGADASARDVGFVAAKVAQTALYDEFFESEERPGGEMDEDYDAYEWDAGLYASIVAAGGGSRPDGSDSIRRRAFWQWYLAQAREIYLRMHP